MRCDPRGSIWRQWDLHFHTPSSFDYRNGAVSNTEIVDRLISEGVAAVAITDHHQIDSQRIHDLQQIAGDRLVVFPGIELRSELGGNESVHYIGIFPEESDLDDLWKKIQVRLNITAKEVADKGGDERIYVPFKMGANILRGLGGIVSVHAGKKTNSIERIANAEEFKQAVKEDLAREHIDIFEVGAVQDIEGYREKVFPTIRFSRPLVIASDNHDVRNYQRKSPCWLRADLTFEGLRHVLHEPESRVFLGELPTLLERVRANRTKYIRSVSINKRPDVNFPEEWFGGMVVLNHGLSAIIGNKGSGKSALADIIGLLGDSHRGDSFSFLHPKKFRLPPGNKARHFEAEICWESDGTARRALDEVVDISSPESVKYIPQSYLEKVCNELNTQSASGFSQELRSVIFSHINAADRLGHEDLDGLLQYLTEQTAAARERLRRDLFSEIDHLIALEGTASPSYRKSLENQLQMKERELASHDATKPVEVPKPDEGPQAAELNAKLMQVIDSLRQEISQLDDKTASLNAERLMHSRRVAASDRFLTRLENLKASVDTFRKESAGDCLELGIDLGKILQFEISEQPVIQAKAESSERVKALAAELDPAMPTSLPNTRKRKAEELQERLSEVDEPQQKFQRYFSELEVWEQKRAEIEGSPEIIGSILHLRKQIASISEVPEKLDLARGRCLEAAVKIFRQILALAEAYRQAFQPVQDFIRTHWLAKGRFNLEFNAAIKCEAFESGFLAFVNQARKGSFYGSEEGRAKAGQLIREADFNSEAGISAFLELVATHLRCDMRQLKPEQITVESQLKGTSATQLYQFLYSLDYLKPQFSLRWAGKDVEQLSPGERGTLLLVFYLLIDRSDVPLIIDQPEENLDNQTVYDVLVPSIKEARDHRQIVIVTHNPNLAVVCDADQVIYASIDKEQGNRVTYTTGALEDPGINRKVVDVLEGTRPAFDNREKKYHTFDEMQSGTAAGK